MVQVIIIIIILIAIVQTLINRFKEFNRVKKERKHSIGNDAASPDDTKKPVKVKRMLTYPVLPEGEDETSFERYF